MLAEGWRKNICHQLRTASARLGRRLDEPLLLGTLAAIAGITLADIGFYHPLSAAAAIVLGLAFFLQSRSRSFLLLAVAGSFALAHDCRQQAISALPFAGEIETGKTLLVDVEGIIDTVPKTSSERPGKVRFFLTLIQIRERGGEMISCDQRIYVSATADPPPRYGDHIRLSGYLRSPSDPRNPGEFDFGRFLMRKGVIAQLAAKPLPGIQLVAHDQGNPVVAAAGRARRWVSAAITRDLLQRDQEIAGVLTAMTLGTREDAEDEIIDSFRTSGTLHIFAVSGLHVGLIGIILWLLIAPVPIDRRLKALAIIVILCSYAFVTGLRPSAVRATIMACLVLSAPLIDREPRVINSLGAAGFLILLFDSNQLFLPGFQLSFAVLLALTMLHKPILELMLPLVSHDPFLPNSLLTKRQRIFYKATRGIAETFAVSLAAWLGSLPLMLFHFHLVTPIAPIANLLLIPFAFAVLGTAILGTFASGIGCSSLGIILNNANFLFATALTSVAGFFANLPTPISHFYTSTTPNTLRPACEITSIDLPRGGASTLIATRSGEDWLVDTGNTRDFKPAISAVLHEHAGVTHIDGLLLTHSDAAHIGAATEVLETFKPDNPFIPLPNRTSSTYRKLEKQLQERGIETRTPERGQIIQIDRDTTIEILYAPSPDENPRLSDDACLVFMLHSHGWRLLFTGDSGFLTEQQLLTTAPDRLRADVIIRGHHKFDHTLTPDFLDAVSPRAIIANARDYENSSPPASTSGEAAAERNIRVFDQGETGAISVHINPGELEIESFLDDQALTLKRAR
ncbi:MAG: competence protein ComEC [Pseudoalteromonas tetraodonis]